MSVSMSTEAPLRRPRRRRRPWLIILLLWVIFLSSVAYGGYAFGKKVGQVDLLDPVWVRAWLNRPLDTAPPGDRFWIAGYYVDYDRISLETVTEQIHHMDQVVIFGYGFDREGNVVGKDQHLIRGVTGPAKRVLLFGNFSDSGFDRETASLIFNDPAVQRRAIDGILAHSLDLEVSGVQIDFEDIAYADRDAYTAFLARLKEELVPRNLTLSVAVAAKTWDDPGGWGGATDYPAIGQIADQVYIMAYDQHWLGGDPGPVAAADWTEQVVRYAVGVMPSQKILLGVPVYGYEWAVDKDSEERNRAFGFNRLRLRIAEHGGEVEWNEQIGENVGRFQTESGEERIAYFPDERSLMGKMQMAYQYNLKGVALWRIGLEPDEAWETLGPFRQNPHK